MSGKLLTRGVLLWGAVGLLIAFATQILFENFWIQAAFAPLAWAVAGAVMIVLRLWGLRRAETRRAALASAGAVVFVAVVVVGLSPFAAQLGAQMVENYRFGQHRAVYESIVAEVAAKQEEAGHHTRDGVPYLVDPGPPLRIAFPWPGGGVVGWCGAVYDPSGEVMRANDLLPDHSNWDEPRLAEIRALFGGNLTDCHPLADEYYVCCLVRALLDESPELPLEGRPMGGRGGS